MKTGFLVGDAMTKKPITIESTLTVEECARLMAERHVGSLVITEGGSATGIVTEQDFVRKVIARGKDAKELPVGEIMAKDPYTIKPDADIYDALVLMRENNIRHLPVEHADDLVGFLTIKDILKVEPQLFDLMVDRFELREESRKPIADFNPRLGECEACGEFSRNLRMDGSARVCALCRPESALLNKP